MELSENLFVIAQIAVTFAGFAGLVAVIGERRGRDEPKWDAARLEGMLSLSLFTAGFALLPFLPYHAGLSQGATWRLCAGIFALSAFVMSIFTLRKLRRLSGYRPATPIGFLWIGLSTAIQLTLAAASVGWVPRVASFISADSTAISAWRRCYFYVWSCHFRSRRSTNKRHVREFDQAERRIDKA